MKFEQKKDKIECLGHNNDSGLTTYAGYIFLSDTGFYMFAPYMDPMNCNDLKSVAAKIHELNMEVSNEHNHERKA